MINDVIKDATARMEKCIHALKTDLTRMRTGRAHPSLLEHVRVKYYDVDTPLSQVANIAVENARTLTVTPWEKNMVSEIEKAILMADLGLNPSSAGLVIRVPLPPLTEDRRRELVKLVREEGERAKVSVRNVRRDANNTLKELVKEKEITEDDERRAQQRVQDTTDMFVKQVDEVLSEKEKDLMEV